MQLIMKYKSRTLADNCIALLFLHPTMIENNTRLHRLRIKILTETVGHFQPWQPLKQIC